MEAQLAFRISAIFSDFLNGRLLICRTELLLMTVSCGAEEKPFDTGFWVITLASISNFLEAEILGFLWVKLSHG